MSDDNRFEKLEKKLNDIEHFLVCINEEIQETNRRLSAISIINDTAQNIFWVLLLILGVLIYIAYQ